MAGIRHTLNKLAKCKAKGICERDKLVTGYLALRMEAYERRMQTFNEKYRADNELPLCPPICREPHLIEQT